MPYKSRAQAAYFNIHRKEMEAQGVNVDEWNSASKGMKLPKHKKAGGAIASALATARKYAKGGISTLPKTPPKMPKAPKPGGEAIENLAMKGSSIRLGREGMINSSIPGRTDKLPMNVKSGSYILPADIPSALGQGNTMAGGQILKNMFNAGPYGMAPMKSKSSRAPIGRLNLSPQRMPKRPFQDGGEADDEGGDDHVPIIAAGGEYLIPPEVVQDIGHGSMKAGHDVLDKFVLKVRKHHIETLKKLPGPKK